MDRAKQIREYANGLMALDDQYEAEDKAKFDAAQIPLPIADDGWIEWKGTAIAPTGDVLVDTMFRNGRIYLGRKAWRRNWEVLGLPSDIIAYRIAGERT